MNSTSDQEKNETLTFQFDLLPSSKSFCSCLRIEIEDIINLCFKCNNQPKGIETISPSIRFAVVGSHLVDVPRASCLVPRASYCESKERIKLAVVSFNNELKKRKETLTLQLIPWGRLGLSFIRFVFGRIGFCVMGERGAR